MSILGICHLTLVYLTLVTAALKPQLHCFKAEYGGFSACLLNGQKVKLNRLAGDAMKVIMRKMVSVIIIEQIATEIFNLIQKLLLTVIIIVIKINIINSKNPPAEPKHNHWRQQGETPATPS